MSHRTPQSMTYMSAQVPRLVILICGALALGYLTWWLDFSRAGSWVLFGLLLFGELYHVWQSLGYLHTIWDIREVLHKEPTTYPPVDVFITVCGEPVALVEKTIRGALGIRYPHVAV